MTDDMTKDEQERHRAKMANRKAAQDAEVASKTVASKGLLIVNTGTGKGKSTAAFGLVLRMVGNGGRCAVVQFIKGAWNTGERTRARRLRRHGALAYAGRRLHLGDAGQGPRHGGGGDAPGRRRRR